MNDICKLCKRGELALRLSTISLLQDDEQIKKYVKWIQNQPASRVIMSKKSNDKKIKNSTRREKWSFYL